MGYIGSGRSRQVGKLRDMIMNDKMGDEEYRELLYNAILNCSLLNKGSYYIFNHPKEIGKVQELFKELKIHSQSVILWVKNRFTLGGSDYQPQIEASIYGLNSTQINKIVVENTENYEVEADVMLYGWHEHNFIGGRKQSNVWFMANPQVSKEHPTMKPVKLIARCILNSSKEGECVLDPFGGSGTTIIASQQTKRNARLIELDPKYCDVICRRFAKYCIENNIQFSIKRNSEECLDFNNIWEDEKETKQ